MAKKPTTECESGLLNRFKQAEGVSFSSVIRNAFSDNLAKSTNPALLKTLDSSHRMQTATFNSAAKAVSSLGKTSPEIALESIRSIERMHTSVLNAQRKESQETRMYIMLAVFAALGGTALYFNREKQPIKSPLTATVSSLKLLKPLETKG
ncbi:hypothetical protein ACT0JU_004049 [Cronobacter dublinensis]